MRRLSIRKVYTRTSSIICLYICNGSKHYGIVLPNQLRSILNTRDSRSLGKRKRHDIRESILHHRTPRSYDEPVGINAHLRTCGEEKGLRLSVVRRYYKALLTVCRGTRCEEEHKEYKQKRFFHRNKTFVRQATQAKTAMQTKPEG